MTKSIRPVNRAGLLAICALVLSGCGPDAADPSVRSFAPEAIGAEEAVLPVSVARVQLRDFPITVSGRSGDHPGSRTDGEFGCRNSI